MLPELPSWLYLKEWSAWTWLDLILRILTLAAVPSVLIRKRGKPLAALGWLFSLFALPHVAVICWWVFGRHYLERKRRKRIRAREETKRRLSLLRSHLVVAPEAAAALTPIRKIQEEESFGVFPPSSGNRVEIFGESLVIFSELEKDLRAAKSSIHLLFYIWEKDETGRRIRDILVEKAKQGVQVRVLCDGVGSRAVHGSFMDPLKAAGGKVGEFLPPKLSIDNISINFRNHRKIAVIDATIGYLGSFNISTEHKRDWYELGARFHGPVLDQLQQTFADDWLFATGEDLFRDEYFGKWKASGDESCAIICGGPDRDNFTHQAFFIAINEAKERIWITTPYLVPDEAVLMALRTAEYRGVDVRILVPEKSDLWLARHAGRSYYPDLIQAGVDIYEYKERILHAKSMIIDQSLAIIGSANMDTRSFKLNFEISCFLSSSRINSELSGIFERDVSFSRKVDLKSIDSQPFFTKVLDAGAHLLSPLL